MTSTQRNPALARFVAAVVVAGVCVLAGAFRLIDWAAPLGARPLVFAALVALTIAAELRPLTWLSGHEGGEITASWAFILGLVLLAPAPAVPAVAAATSLCDTLRGRPWHRNAFNAAQMAISVATAAGVVTVFGTTAGLWRSGGPTVAWLLSAVAAGVAAVAVNTTLIVVAVALTQQLPVFKILRSAGSVNLTMDAMMLALAPVMTGIAVDAPVLLPVLLGVAFGVYYSARLGLASRYEASHDLLTGLPNRRHFMEQAALALGAAAKHGREVALLLVDLDGFKEINDRLGHAVGDLTLREVGRRLLTRRRSADVVARLGGDEFVVLLVGNPDALAVAQRLDDDLHRALDVDGVPVGIGGSIGVAMFPRDAEDVGTLLARADAAMYRAKTSRTRLGIYADDQDRSGPTRLGLLSEIGRAIADGELFVEYQPTVDLATGEARGVEALVRWNHPTRGVLPPNTFMSTVEQTELADAFTDHVLGLAVAQAAAWHRSGRHLTVAVNTSARNLADIAFPERVRAILEQHALPGERLLLEITENTVTSDPVRAETVLARLRSLGVRTAIDDFGTGYSSLARLRSLPIDQVKIDRSFVAGLRRDASDESIVRCIIDLANNLGLETVAEGIEDGETLALLRRLGCQQGQGFLFGAATAAENIAATFETPDRAAPVPSLAVTA